MDPTVVGWAVAAMAVAATEDGAATGAVRRARAEVELGVAVKATAERAMEWTVEAALSVKAMMAAAGMASD